MKSVNVKSIFAEYIENLPDSYDVQLYIITKGTKRNPENALFPNHVKIKNNVRKIMGELFASDLSQKYDNVAEGRLKLGDLLTHDVDKHDYLFLEKKKNKVLSSFIDKIQNYVSDGSIEATKNMIKSKGFCARLTGNTTNAIAFGSIPYIRAEDTEGIATKLVDNTLDHIEEDIVVFSNQIDALYIVDSELLIIFNESNMKKVLGFDEYYKALSIDAILELDSLVETNKVFLEKNLVNVSVINDIVRIVQGPKFEKTIDNYREYEKVFIKNKDLDPKFTAIDITKDNKIRLDTKNKLHTFVRMSRRNILQDPLSPRELYIVYGKKSMNK